MNTKKLIIAVTVLLALFIIYNIFFGKKASAATIDNNLPPSDEPNPNNQFTDVNTTDTGKKAYSLYGNATLYTLNFNSVSTPAQDELIGTITGAKSLSDTAEVFYVIDSKYLVSVDLVRTE